MKLLWNQSIRWWVAAAVTAAMAGPVCADIAHECASTSVARQASRASTDPYMRTQRVDETTMRLDMAVRIFGPADGDGPTVMMAGAIHVADADFYRLLMEVLRSQDLVLYEGVKPRGMTAGEDLDDADRVRQTQSRIRFVATMLERMKSTQEGYAEDLESLAVLTEEKNESMGRWLRSSMVDAWNRPLIYERIADLPASFSLISLGSDGATGGAGTAADLSFASQKPLTKQELGGEPGIQSRLAKSLGLAFQLEAMNMERPGFQNSDMTLDQIEDAAAARGGDASMLLGVLDGSSALAGVLKFGLAIIERNPRLQAMTKVTLMQTFQTAESRLEDLRGLPPTMAGLFEAIIEDRNQVVVEDLKLAMSDGRHASIGIVYGAGHLPDLERRLHNQLDYVPRGTFWLPAITVDVSTAGMTAADLDGLQRMLERVQ